MSVHVRIGCEDFDEEVSRVCEKVVKRNVAELMVALELDGTQGGGWRAALVLKLRETSWLSKETKNLIA